MWYPEVLNKMTHFSKLRPNQVDTVCTAINYFTHENDSSEETLNVIGCKDSVNDEVFMVTLAVGGTFAVLYILMGTFINIIGNRNILMVFFIFTTISGLVSQYVEGVDTAQILMGIFLTVGTTIGVINTIVVELFPTQLRAMALAISLMAGRFGAVTGSNLTGPILYNICEYTFYIFAADHVGKLMNISFITIYNQYLVFNYQISFYSVINSATSSAKATKPTKDDKTFGIVRRIYKSLYLR